MREIFIALLFFQTMTILVLAYFHESDKYQDKEHTIISTDQEEIVLKKTYLKEDFFNGARTIVDTSSDVYVVDGFLLAKEGSVVQVITNKYEKKFLCPANYEGLLVNCYKFY